jgi:hypothetical protein
MPAPTEIVIRNRAVEARVDRATGTFSLIECSTGRAFVQGARMGPGDAVSVLSRAAPDPMFGRGKAVDVTRADGRTDTLLLYPALPFALLQTALHNARASAQTVEHLLAASLTLDIGVPIDTLAALGTGGLRPAAEAPGSYVWMALADPATRAGVVCGWLTNHRGSGVVLPSVEAGRPVLTAQIDYGKLRLEPDAREALETFAIGRFADARLGLEAWAGLVARLEKVKLPRQPAGYCTWYHAGASNETQLAAQSEFAARELGRFGFSFAQIDDGWQDGVSRNGPNRIFARHRPDGPYPSGMEATADRLRGLGLTAGIWFMPFAGTYYDPFFADKQEWFVRKADGAPYETDWGGTCLDMTHPDARAYLKANAVRTAREWGYGYFKMDGLWTGTATKQQYVNDAYRPDGIGDATFHDPSKTNVEAYRSGLKLVREAAGPEVFFLGCCIPQNMRSYGPAFGLVDAMRIGPDNGPDWGGMLTGPSYGSRHYFLNGRVWWNDPDPVYVRPGVPLEQARALCTWAAIAGQLTVCSDSLPDLPADRLDLLKRIMPYHGLNARPVDLFDQPIPRVWVLTDDRKGRPLRHVAGLFNWSDQGAEISATMEQLGLDPSAPYAAFDYWANKRLPDQHGSVRLTLPGRSCVALALRPLQPHPFVLGTNRHVTQGVIDLPSEKWSADTGALSGRSKVVAGDTYELRIACGTEAATATVSAADARAGVTIELRQEPGLVRATIRSKTSRTVAWSIGYTRQHGPGS